MLACSIVMFLSDMSGREPLYRKYEKDFCFFFLVSEFQNLSLTSSNSIMLIVVFLPVSISWFQSICIFQFTYPKGTCKSHKEWYKCSTPHRCIERGQHFLLLLLSTSNGSFYFSILFFFKSYIWLAYADEFGILSCG